MDKFETLRVFLAVADRGSFVAASHALGLSAPAVTRAVARLESDLGIRLLNRTTRAVRLSEAGQRYSVDARGVLENLAAADAAVSGRYSAPQGALTLTAPVLFGERYVLPVIAEFLATYPAVNVHAVFLDRVANLLEDNLDVAVRLGSLADSGLFYKSVGSVRKVVCAAPGYLRENGRPKKPADLAAHAVVHATSVEPSTTWTFGQDRVRTTPRLQCNQNGAAIAAAINGLGITRVMSYQVADSVAAGALEVLLESAEPPRLPINLVYLDGRQASATIRAFVDFAAQRLMDDPGLNPDGAVASHGD
ncbi:MAG: LysR family transcriptional regulator [Pseudomonadales bacterium]